MLKMLFKDVERGGTHKKNIINVKYSSNTNYGTYDNNLLLIIL